MRVCRHISGSHCVVFLREGADPPYIDAQPLPSSPDLNSVLYAVVGGHVRHREVVPNSQAPKRILHLAREYGPSGGGTLRVLGENTQSAPKGAM